jgi:pimeloyl-ACP methyl ester carboxylesterase
MAARKSAKPPAQAAAEWDRLEDVLAEGPVRGKTRTAAQQEVETLFDEAERRDLQRLAQRAKLVRSRSAPIGNVVFLHGITGSNLAVVKSGNSDNVWINIWRVLTGRVADLRLDDSGRKEANDALTVRITGINKSFYARGVLALRARWNVEAFAYDWRRDIDEASDALAEFIRDRFPDRHVHLVVHSMGGLVARNFIRRHSQLWERMKDPELVSGGRLVMLGTPNYGSFAIPPVLTGGDSMMKMLARVDTRHNMLQLLSITNTFLGSYMLLPSPSKLAPHLQSIYQRDTWGSTPGVSQQHLNRTYQFYMDLERAPTVDPARMFYVAGCRRVTMSGMTIVAPGEFEYELTTDGDGRVPHDLGLLPDVPTYYVDEVHGDLARNDTVLSAVDDLLATGKTEMLTTSLLRRVDRARPTMREYRSAADKRLLEELGRIADRQIDSEDDLTEDEKRVAEQAVIKAALGSSVRSLPTAAVEPPRRAKPATFGEPVTIEATTRFGDITEIKTPLVVVGHFRGVRPSNAIGAIDAKLGGWIGRAVRQGMIAGTLGETFYVPTAGRLGANAVVVAGMGDFGRFTAPDLRLMMSNVAQGACALGFDSLATVLVGAGDGNVNREIALREILEGFGNGLGQLGAEAGKPAATLRVAFVERSSDKFFDLNDKLAELAQAGSLSSVRLQLKKPAADDVKRARAAGSRGRVAEAGRRQRQVAAATQEVRLTVESHPEREGSYRFSALSQKAVVPVREVDVHQHFALEAARALRDADTRDEQEKYGRLLYDYLMPHDFLDLLDGNQPLRLIVDRSTASFPWEMACFPTRSGAAGLRWLGTDLKLSRQFRTTLSQAPGLSPPLNDRLRVLVIADPAPERELQLRGARMEGRKVAELFKAASGHDFGGGPLRVEVVERIGSGECDPIEILALLLTGDFDVVHFAGHGDYNASDPDSTGWVFGETTVLTARDIFRARQVPRLVFANACFSGVLHGGRAFAADELNKGLATIAQAFFERGVPNYIGSGWPVDDAQALTMAEVFYTSVLQRFTLGNAVAAARGAVFAEQVQSTWGAYQHYGNPQDHLVRSPRDPAD